MASQRFAPHACCTSSNASLRSFTVGMAGWRCWLPFQFALRQGWQNLSYASFKEFHLTLFRKVLFVILSLAFTIE